MDVRVEAEASPEKVRSGEAKDSRRKEREAGHVGEHNQNNWQQRPNDSRRIKHVGLRLLWTHALEIDKVLTKHGHSTTNLKYRREKFGPRNGKR